MGLTECGQVKQYKLCVFTQYLGRERENPWSGQQEWCTDQAELWQTVLLQSTVQWHGKCHSEPWGGRQRVQPCPHLCEHNPKKTLITV